MGSGHLQHRAIKEILRVHGFFIDVGYDSSAASVVGTAPYRLAEWNFEQQGTHDPT